MRRYGKPFDMQQGCSSSAHWRCNKKRLPKAHLCVLLKDVHIQALPRQAPRRRQAPHPCTDHHDLPAIGCSCTDDQAGGTPSLAAERRPTRGFCSSQRSAGALHALHDLRRCRV